MNRIGTTCDDKRTVFSKSGYDLTKEVGRNQAWGLEEIRTRQARLAKLAVKTWPVV